MVFAVDRLRMGCWRDTMMRVVYIVHVSAASGRVTRDVEGWSGELASWLQQACCRFDV